MTLRERFQLNLRLEGRALFLLFLSRPNQEVRKQPHAQ
ncbi:hypothetical protein ABID59_007015 [Bradyrhizobium sp. S3.3.6]